MWQSSSSWGILVKDIWEFIVLILQFSYKLETFAKEKGETKKTLLEQMYGWTHVIMIGDNDMEYLFV